MSPERTTHATPRRRTPFSARRTALALGIVLPTLLLAGGWLLATRRERDARAEDARTRLTRSAAAVSAAVDESLEELRRREDARPFYVYNHFYVPPEVFSVTDPIAVSPLAGDPDDPRIVGHFQVDPGGAVRTPYAAEPGDAHLPRAAQVLAMVRSDALRSVRALAFGAPAPAIAMRTPAVAPSVVPTSVAPRARRRINDDTHAVDVTSDTSAPALLPPAQLTVGLNEYNNQLYQEVAQAQAGDPGANLRVQSRGRQAPVPIARNAVSWESQLATQAAVTGSAPPVQQQQAAPQQQAVPQQQAALTPTTPQATPRPRPRRRMPAAEPPLVVQPAPIAMRPLPGATDRVDYTPMGFTTVGDALLLTRVVSNGGASSVQGVVLDRAVLLGRWLPALVARHAIAGAVPRIETAPRASTNSRRCALPRPLSANLPGVTLCFPASALTASIEPLDARLRMEALVLCALLAAIALAVLLIDRAARRADELSRQKSAFVSAVSHELRTPLTTIRMHAELLRDGLVPEAKRAKFHADIAQESVRLARLVDNVLEISRLEEGQRPLRKHTADLGAHVRGVLASQERLLEARGFRVERALPDAPLHARFDPQALELVLVNLIENAVKYAADQGCERTLRVELSSDAERVHLHVLDRGPGIPVAERERVFERFHRVETERAAHVVGTGLGLALVRELSRAHGGDATCAARKGGGLDVCVWLPLGTG